MKVYYVKKARASKKGPRHCRRCGHEIAEGEAYKYITPRYRPEMIFCNAHSPRQSDMSGGRISEVYAMQEALEDDLNTFREGNLDLDGLTSSISTAAEEATRLAEEYNEGADSQEEYFPGSSTAEEGREKATALEEWAQELEGLSLDDFDDGDLSDEPEREEDEDDEAFDIRVSQHEDEVVEKKDEWRDDIASEVDGVLSNLSL